MSEVDKDYLASLDRRIVDHDNKLASSARDHTELAHEIKELLNRINNGVSPSVNKVRDDNVEIKSSLKDLAHQIDLDMRGMKDMVRETTEHTRLMVTNFEKHRLEPVEREIGFMKKTFLYGLVGAGLVFAGNITLGILWKKFFESRVVVTVPAQGVIKE